MKIRLENVMKLSWGIEIGIENFKKFLEKAECEMKKDFLAGTEKSTETENKTFVNKPELHKLKAKIEHAFDHKM